MKKYSVLIAEDEPGAARFIRRIVEQTDGFAVSSVCESAEEALVLLNEVDVDVIITDIKMAEMSGLELLERIHEKMPRIQFVIISGYERFEYAQKAISLSVSSYLLKPVDPDELRESLSRIYKTIAKQQKQMQTDYLNSLTVRSAEYIAHPRTIPFPSFSVLMVSGSFDLNNLIVRWQEEYDLKEDQSIELLFYRYSLTVMESGQPGKRGSKLQKLATSVLLSCDPNETTGLVLLQEDRVRREDAEKVFAEMYTFHQRRYIFGRMQILTYQPTTVHMEASEKEKQITDSIIQGLATRNNRSLLSSLQQIADYWEENRSSLYDVKHLIYGLTICAFRLTSNQVDPVIEANKIMKKIYLCSTYESVHTCLKEYAQSLLLKTSKKNDGVQTQGYQVFWKIVDFLNTYIDRNYTLQEIAETFNYSQPYISKLFRTYADSSYKEYVTNLKISTAVQLMENDPTMLIKDIAEKLGYDQLYFSTVFYRIVGQYPKQYRDKQRTFENKNKNI